MSSFRSFISNKYGPSGFVRLLTASVRVTVNIKRRKKAKVSAGFLDSPTF
jgi:hypothetical protein